MIERLPRAHLRAVSDVTLEVEERSVYALVGESSSGKSAIGKVVVGLLAPGERSVEIAGIDLHRETGATKVEKAGSDIQMILQSPCASLNPRWKGRDIIAEPVAARRATRRGWPPDCCSRWG